MIRPLGGRVRSALTFFCVAVGASHTVAFAQVTSSPALRPGHFVLGGGLVLAGGYPIGDAAAQLRPNAIGSTTPPFNWFSSTSRIQAAPGAALRIEYALTSRVTIESGGAYMQPVIGVSFSQDAETAAVRIDGETVHQLVVEGGATWQLPLRHSGRVTPFVGGGAGYLRQLHEGRTLVETGQVYSVGGGARYWLRGGRGTVRPVGVRADVRAVWRRHGIDFANKTRVSPTATVSLFVGL